MGEQPIESRFPAAATKLRPADVDKGDPARKHKRDEQKGTGLSGPTRTPKEPSVPTVATLNVTNPREESRLRGVRRLHR